MRAIGCNARHCNDASDWQFVVMRSERQVIRRPFCPILDEPQPTCALKRNRRRQLEHSRHLLVPEEDPDLGKRVTTHSDAADPSGNALHEDETIRGVLARCRVHLVMVVVKQEVVGVVCRVVHFQIYPFDWGYKN